MRALACGLLVSKPRTQGGPSWRIVTRASPVCGRQLLCRRIESQGWTVTAAAQAAGVSRQTASKWLAALRLEGCAGLADRSAAAPRAHRARPAARCAASCALRLRLRCGRHRIAWRLGLAALERLRRAAPPGPEPPAAPRRRAGGRSCATAGRPPATSPPRHQEARAHRARRRQALRRRTAAAPPRHRLERRARGRRRRHRGWPTPRSCPTSAPTTAAAFLERALAFYARPRHRGERAAHRQRRLPTARTPSAPAAPSTASAALHARPYRPQTNGKAEAFVKLLQNGWAYRRPYDSTAGWSLRIHLRGHGLHLRRAPGWWRPSRAPGSARAQGNAQPAAVGPPDLSWPPAEPTANVSLRRQGG